MSLIKLVKNLDNYTKTKLLGEETTRILRSTFLSEEVESFSTILDQAILVKCGSDLVNKARNRKLLLENAKWKGELSEIVDRVENYSKNRAEFVQEFNIEQKYQEQTPKDDRKNQYIVKPIYGECNGILAYPHDYQKRLKDALGQRLISSVHCKIMASMPTGAGKTMLAMELLVDFIRNSTSFFSRPCATILWVVDSKELAEQSLGSFAACWNQKGDQPVNCLRYFGNFKVFKLEDESPNVVFATFDLLTSRLDRPEIEALWKNLDFMVVDEAHLSKAFTYEDVIYRYETSNKQHRVLALTATPFRSDDQLFSKLKTNFSELFQIVDSNGENVSSPIDYLVERQFLSDIQFEILNSSKVDYSNKDQYYRELQLEVLEQCKILLSLEQNTIIFAQSKAHAVAISVFLTMSGIENGLIIGETPDNQRKILLNRFRRKEVKVLVNHEILSTGIDVPKMDSIMVLSDIQSPVLAMQVMGRAMRGPRNGGNANNKIFLTKDNKIKLANFKLFEQLGLKN